MRSKYERSVADALTELGVTWEYEAYRFRYKVPIQSASCEGCGATKGIFKSSWYTPDFWLPDHRVFLETKGRFISKDRTKMQAVFSQHPEETFVMVFASDNKLHPSSSTRYTEWCSKTGLKSLIVPRTRSGQVQISELSAFLKRKTGR